MTGMTISNTLFGARFDSEVMAVVSGQATKRT